MADRMDTRDDRSSSRKTGPVGKSERRTAPVSGKPQPASAVGGPAIAGGTRLQPAVTRSQDNRDTAGMGAWLQANPWIAYAGVAGIFLLAVLVALDWQFHWVGGRTPTKQTAANDPATPGAPTAHAAPLRVPPPPPVAPVAPTPKPAPGPRLSAAKPAVVILPLPADVRKWKPDDYFRARRENIPRLKEAVTYLGTVTLESAAQLLTDLLKPLSTDKAAGGVAGAGVSAGVPQVAATSLSLDAVSGGAPGSPPPRPCVSSELSQLVEAIVTALGNNGTRLARESLQRILAGTLPTDDDKVAVETAIKALAAHGCAENDALLLRLLITPDELRTAAHQGVWPARDLRTRAIELIRPAASFELRTRAAESLVAARVGIDLQDALPQWLLGNDPMACGAQLILYERSPAVKEMKPTLAQQFAAYSSVALSRYLRLAEEAKPAGGAAGASGAAGAAQSTPAGKLPRQLAGLLWGERFRGQLEPDLGIHSLERQAPLLLLASTIPQDSTRAALAKTLHKRLSDGPKALEAEGLTDRVVTDPGLLVLTKLLPRKELAALQGRPRGRPGGKSGEMTRRQQAEKDWCVTTSKLVATWCKRFYAAARAAEKAELAAANSVSPPTAAGMPEGFALNPDARVTAVYDLVWPAKAPEELGRLISGSLEIHYLRAEETGRLAKIKSYYTLQAQDHKSGSRSEVRSAMDKKIWIDNVRSVADGEHRRSLDVIITPPANYTAPAKAKDEEDVDLVIEVLTVEIKDPAKVEEAGPAIGD